MRYGVAVILTLMCGLAGESIGQQTPARLFRVSATNETSIVQVRPDGTLSWTGHPTGLLARVEAVYDPADGSDWAVYTHVLSGVPTGSVRGWDADTPAGFSFIPAGTFWRGSPPDELGRDSDEAQSQVTLTRDFYMQQTEVTNRQMADVLNWALGEGLVAVTTALVYNVEGSPQELLDLDSPDCQLTWDGSTLEVAAGKEEYPCIEVTWFGGQAYANYQSDRDGLARAVDLADWSVNLDATGYRLPTEAEWEYACRAGTATAFYTGDITHLGSEPVDPNLDLAGWYLGNSTNPDNPMYEGKGSHPVGRKVPNHWGLFDMHGNVWEWCGDWYGVQFGTIEDPVGPPTGTFKVARGCSWFFLSQNCRSAFRGIFNPFASTYGLGFRPVRKAP